MTDQIVLMNAPGDLHPFHVRDQPPALPGPGEVRVRQQAVGVNFIDIYHRKGLYALPAYPAVIGVEAAGIVEAAGPGVFDVKPGDRVAYAGPPVGAYASARVMAAERLIPLPDTISAQVAASSLFKGMTTYMLLHHVARIGEGQVVLVHAAAGGLGSLLVQWAKALGAIVIGTVSTPEKAALAVSYGADHLIVGRDADVVAEVMRLTDANGVDVAYDGIGGDMLSKTLRAVRPFGMAVTIGQVSGPIPPIAVEALRPGKSLSHPSIMAWCADVGRYREAAEAAIDAMGRGMVCEIAAEYRLSDVAQAHEAIESGRLSGRVVLIP